MLQSASLPWTSAEKRILNWSSVQPQAAAVPKLRPVRLYRIAPVGVVGCIAVGLANGALWAWAPIFAQDHGLSRAWLSIFMSALIRASGFLVRSTEPASAWYSRRREMASWMSIVPIGATRPYVEIE